MQCACARKATQSIAVALLRARASDARDWHARDASRTYAHQPLPNTPILEEAIRYELGTEALRMRLLVHECLHAGKIRFDDCKLIGHTDRTSQTWRR